MEDRPIGEIWTFAFTEQAWGLNVRDVRPEARHLLRPRGYVRFPDGVWSRPRRLTERVSRRMDWYSACGEIRALQGLGFGLSTDARKLLDGRA